MFFHRPSNPACTRDPALFDGPYRRRYHPARLPRGITQVIGHISDRKCREILGDWAASDATPTGALRHLQVFWPEGASNDPADSEAATIRYAPCLPDHWLDPARARAADSACMIFTDNDMRRAAPHEYQLLDLSALLA